MTNPAVSIALLILTLFAIFGLIAWFMKGKVHTFVRALSVHQTIPHTSEAQFSSTMASRTALRSFSRSLNPSRRPAAFVRPFSSSNALHNTTPTSDRPTHFGYETVTEGEKQQRVAGVFTSVAESYDKMNDLMSLGIHRLWKDYFISSLNPGATNPPGQPQRILDVAGGTGDIAFRHLQHAHEFNRNPNVTVTISDINPDMLAVGRQRSLALPASHQSALSFLEANAEVLPSQLEDNSLDLYTVAFGIRNFSNIPAALKEAHRVLKPGGVFACLEFSKVDKYPLFNAVYKQWSFSAIPLIGQLVAGDRDSYQYLVESIERFPSQVEFRNMIKDAGFVVAGEGYEDLTGGIAAIHKGMKPL
ncbi:2-methoxy-6-polyprenyl-1,4-benzoquinol methylase, mitochondrial [Fusarium falciforme]|uniref:2-methoxy-6-polyprenyl-1,4-benzoquinol methylase, mitochondrial n=1 Tax=Fusarium falciforme TaxID=195108 RepID=UPI0023013B36|nr:2-methoxy-6-polyprenyl-1,4-benzoquinol methylase, mitochondrial [Fusarium falciforme]WAO85821.1 2-methoxy-6-polyprenyl-1,4-benzoquinol methylase, mitochondrial [Fusarium falciforme]